MYEIRFTSRAKKQLLKLDASPQDRVIEAVDRMRDWPDWTLDIAPLKGRLQGSFRLRVGGYRVIFTIDHDEQIISVAAVVPRGSAYR